MQLDNDPGRSHGVKTGAGTNEHFNEHTGFDFVVVVAAAFFFSCCNGLHLDPNQDGAQSGRSGPEEIHCVIVSGLYGDHLVHL